MKIVHSQPETLSLLSTIKGDKDHPSATCSELSRTTLWDQPDNLPNADKQLLFQMAEAFTIITGGQFKKRRQSA